MADDGGGFGLALAALIDILVGEAGKKKRWMRLLGAVGTLFLVALIVGLIYITFKYS